jgi:DNA-binding transcriptional LysR family regulator
VKLTCRCGDVPGLADLLARHPRVALEDGSTDAALEFVDQGRRRAIHIGPGEGVFGLVELMDNNPLVCADVVRVPSALSTPALIALGPLIRAGILCERPVVIAGDIGSLQDVDESLAALGWDQGVTLETAEGTAPCAAAAVLAVVETPQDENELDDLYDEAYGRSFFVRRDEASDWTPELVVGRPHAVFRVSMTPGGAQSLLYQDSCRF